MNNKYLFGSKMLKLDNNRDEDWLTFVNTKPTLDMEKGYRSISFFKTIISNFVSGRNVPSDVHKACYFYQLSREFQNDADYPFNDFSVLEHKAVWIEHLKNYMNLDSTEQNAIKSDILPKKFYHILYQYNMIIEDTVWISDEAKVNVQKIHDLEMPSSYFYELKGLINSL